MQAPSPPAPLPILGEGSYSRATSSPLAQDWERRPGGEGALLRCNVSFLAKPAKENVS